MNKLDFEIFFEQIFQKSEISPVAKTRHGIYTRTRSYSKTRFVHFQSKPDALK